MLARQTQALFGEFGELSFDRANEFTVHDSTKVKLHAKAAQRAVVNLHLVAPIGKDLEAIDGQGLIFEVGPRIDSAANWIKRACGSPDISPARRNVGCAACFLNRRWIIGITFFSLDGCPTNGKTTASSRDRNVKVAVGIPKRDTAFTLRDATADPLAVKRIDRNILCVARRAQETVEQEKNGNYAGRCRNSQVCHTGSPRKVVIVEENHVYAVEAILDASARRVKQC